MDTESRLPAAIVPGAPPVAHGMVRWSGLAVKSGRPRGAITRPGQLSRIYHRHSLLERAMWATLGLAIVPAECIGPMGGGRGPLWRERGELVPTRRTDRDPVMGRGRLPASEMDVAGKGSAEMIINDLVRALLRRWYVVIIGIACTGLVCLHVVTHDGVYWSRVDVILLAPASNAYPNSLTTRSGDLIQTAGIVETILNGTRQPRKMASTEATIIGQGVVDGFSVTLPDYGGQWAPNFNRPVLDVQVVASSPQEVRARQERIVGEIHSILEDLQAQASVDPVNRITAEVAVPTPTIHHAAGDRQRALLMSIVLGSAVTLVSVILLEGRKHGGRPGSRPAA